MLQRYAFLRQSVWNYGLVQPMLFLRSQCVQLTTNGPLTYLVYPLLLFEEP